MILQDAIPTVAGRVPFKPDVRIAVDRAALSRAAAMELVGQSTISIRGKGFFTICLSGGSTPGKFYSLLATDPSFRKELPWDKIHFFWGDERHVPPNHADSNYRLARLALLSKVPVPPENIHPIRAENPDAHQAAVEYEETLRDFFRLKAGEFPRFDFVLLGMGTDGHTASLFPGTEALHERRRLVVANWVEKFQAYRMTLTIPVFNQAALLLFLVSGEEKAEMVKAVLEDKGEEPFPCQLIRPFRGRLVWLVDRMAAHLLQRLPD